MIPENKTMVLGTRKFVVPPLPIGINQIVYPLCRELTNSDLMDRCIKAGNVLDCTPAEMGQLADLAFYAAGAAEPGLGRPDFDALPIMPGQLIDAFFLIRFQTGGWLPAAEGNAPGEAPGA